MQPQDELGEIPHDHGRKRDEGPKAMSPLENMTELELLQTHGAIIDELLRRGVVRTRNNPIGDYTEWLVCKSLQLKMQGNSQASYDAIDSEGVRYQIKGRQSDKRNVQLSAVRNLEKRGFDYAIAVVFHHDYSIRIAVKISHQDFSKLATYRPHVNAHILVLSDNTIGQLGVEDIAAELSRTY